MYAVPGLVAYAYFKTGLVLLYIFDFDDSILLVSSWIITSIATTNWRFATRTNNYFAKKVKNEGNMTRWLSLFSYSQSSLMQVVILFVYK